MVTFSVCDPSIPELSDAVKVRIFAPTVEGIPAFTRGKDVILLRGVKLFVFNNEKMLISNRQSGFYFILGQDVQAPTPQLAKVPASERRRMFQSEAKYMAHLYQWWKKVQSGPRSTLEIVQATQGKPADNRPKNKYSLMRHLEPNKYYEVCGQVVKTWDVNQRFSMHITDYTENPLFYNHEWGKYKGIYTRDPVWPGPFGKYTIQVTLWKTNAAAAMDQRLGAGQYVVLRNLRTKFDVGYGECLEGHLDSDKRYPDQVDFRIVTDEDMRVKEIMQRKKEYEKRFNAEKIKFEAILEEKIAEQERANAGDDWSIRRGAYEKQHKSTDSDDSSESEAEARSDDRSRTRSRSTASPPAVRRSSPSPKRKSTASKKSSKPAEPRLNPRIKSENPSQPVTSISELRSLAPDHYVNNRYRIRCRVVDFRPTNILDFSKLEEETEDEDDSDQEMGMVRRPEKNWQWRFAVQVEDEEGQKLQVIIHEKEAEYLLKFEAVE